MIQIAKIIVDLNEHTINCVKCGQGIGWMSNAQLEEAIKNGVVIPDNAINGDVIKALFPKSNMAYRLWTDNTYFCETDWWNSPYKEGDTNGNS